MVDSILVQIVLEINNNKGIHHNNGLVEKMALKCMVISLESFCYFLV